MYICYTTFQHAWSFADHLHSAVNIGDLSLGREQIATVSKPHSAFWRIDLFIADLLFRTISYLTALDGKTLLSFGRFLSDQWFFFLILLVYAISSIVVLCIINVFHGIISYIYYNQIYLASSQPSITNDALQLSLYPDYSLCRLDRYAFFIFLSSFALYQILILIWTFWVPYKRRRAMSHKDEKNRAQLTNKNKPWIYQIKLALFIRVQCSISFLSRMSLAQNYSSRNECRSLSGCNRNLSIGRSHQRIRLLDGY